MHDGFAEVDSLQTFRAPRWFEALVQWIGNHNRALLLAGVAFQLLVLVSMIAIHSMPLAFGDRIWLRVQPVDPATLFAETT